MTVFLTTHYMEEAAAAGKIIIIGKGRIIDSGTPFELKEKYASDHVRVFCKPEAVGKISDILTGMGYAPERTDLGLGFPVASTIEAMEPLNAVRSMADGFEVLQGSN